MKRYSVKYLPPIGAPDCFTMPDLPEDIGAVYEAAEALRALPERGGGIGCEVFNHRGEQVALIRPWDPTEGDPTEGPAQGPAPVDELGPDLQRDPFMRDMLGALPELVGMLQTVRGSESHLDFAKAAFKAVLDLPLFDEPGRRTHRATFTVAPELIAARAWALADAMQDGLNRRFAAAPESVDDGCGCVPRGPFRDELGAWQPTPCACEGECPCHDRTAADIAAEGPTES